MYIYETKRILTLLLQKKKLIICKNQLIITKFLVGKPICMTKGLFSRILVPKKDMVGIKSGEYISTRKLFHRPKIKKFKR